MVTAWMNIPNSSHFMMTIYVHSNKGGCLQQVYRYVCLSFETFHAAGMSNDSLLMYAESRRQTSSPVGEILSQSDRSPVA